MKETCEFCNGTGQISYFKGVSRFLLSSEDCPECAGIGFILREEIEDQTEKVKKRGSKKKNQKN